VLDPLGMVQSTYEQPLSMERDAKAARAHSSQAESMDAKWHVYPEKAAAGLWTTPTDFGAICHRGPTCTSGTGQPSTVPEHGEGNDYPGWGRSVCNRVGD
jgi:hypothetical protein